MIRPHHFSKATTLLFHIATYQARCKTAPITVTGTPALTPHPTLVAPKSVYIPLCSTQHYQLVFECRRDRGGKFKTRWNSTLRIKRWEAVWNGIEGVRNGATKVNPKSRKGKDNLRKIKRPPRRKHKNRKQRHEALRKPTNEKTSTKKHKI